MRSVLLDDLDTMDDARLRDAGDDWGARRPELRKHKTMKTIEQLMAENRAPNTNTEPEATPSRTTPRRTTTTGAEPSAKAFQLLRDYEMATNILEARHRGRTHYSLDQLQQKHRLDKVFRSAPGGTTIVLDTASPPRSPDETVRRALRSASAALLAKNSTDSGNEDTASSRDEDSSSGAGKKKKKTVSFQDENTASTASSSGATARPSAMSSSSRRHHMDHARCNDDETGPGNGHLTSPIHAACYKGDHLVVSHLLGFYNGEDATKLVNSSCTCGMTPLQVACDMGHAKVVKLLLRRNARVNKRHHRHTSSSSGSSPVVGLPPAGFSTIGVGKKRHRSCIALACSRRCAEIVEMLLEHGATVDEDALVTASSLGDAQSVRLLMQKRGHRNGGHGLTSGFEKLWGSSSSPSTSNVSEIEPSWISNAAAIAVVNDQPLVLSVLLGNGQSTLSRERVANCAVDAAMTADYKLLRCLTKMYDPVLLTQTKDSHGNSLLHLAVKQASTKCVMLLIRLGIDVNTRDALGITPLYMACARGQSDIVKLLVNAGATSECMGPNDETPLHIAAQENQLACVQILLTDGRVPVDGTTLDKCTALHLACQRGNTQVAKCLLDHGANINARTVCDETPLLKASRMSNLETVKLLLSRDAEIATSSTSSISSCASSTQAAQAATGEYMHTASTSSSVFSTNSSVRSVDFEVEESTSNRRRRKPEQQAGQPSSDSIFIAKSNTHTSFKGWLKSVVRNK